MGVQEILSINLSKNWNSRPRRLFSFKDDMLLPLFPNARYAEQSGERDGEVYLVDRSALQ